LKPQGSSASDYFNKLQNNPGIGKLSGVIKRKFVVALMDHGQQVINKYLSGDEKFDEILECGIGIDYALYKNYFFLAAELLGEKHYYYNNLMSNAYYFQSFELNRYYENEDTSDYYDLKSLRQALSYTPEAPHIILNIAWLSSRDSFVNYIKKIETIAPEWIKWKMNFGAEYIYTDPKKSISLYKETLNDETYYLEPYWAISEGYNVLNEPDSVTFYKNLYITKFYEKLNAEPDYLPVSDYFFLAHILLGLDRTYELEKVLVAEADAAVCDMYFGVYLELWNYYMRRGKFDQAEMFYKNHMPLDVNEELTSEYYNDLGWLYLRQKKYEPAKENFLKLLEFNPGYLGSNVALEFIFRNNGDHKKADSYLKASLLDDPDKQWRNFFLAIISSLNNKYQNGFEYLEKSLQNGFDLFDLIVDNHNLQNLWLHDGEKWNALLIKYKVNTN